VTRPAERLAPDLLEVRNGPVERLMSTKAESRFEFIQERAEFASEDLLDV